MTSFTAAILRDFVAAISEDESAALWVLVNVFLPF